MCEPEDLAIHSYSTLVEILPLILFRLILKISYNKGIINLKLSETNYLNFLFLYIIVNDQWVTTPHNAIVSVQ